MPEPSINCLVTADYEIFLGRNFLSHEEVLFAPTRQLMDVCRAHAVPVTLFADVCSAWAHREYGEFREYVHTFESQLKDAVEVGHDVQLHIHPHWLKSTYADGAWRLSTDQMYLHELGFHDGLNSAGAVIKAGIEYLENLLKPVRPGYHCHAFRAAGLALQPNEKELITALLRYGISIDSSVVKNVRLKMDTIEIDYSNMPNKANWFMSPETGIREPTPGGLLEVPVATFRSGLATRLGFLIRRAKSVSMQRGSSISRSPKQTRLANLMSLMRYNLRYVTTNPWFLFSCDTKGVNLKMLMEGLEQYVSGHRQSEDISLSMINHPKMMFRQQFDLMSNLFDSMRQRYGDRLRFVTSADILAQAHEIEGTKNG
ncbi:MAG: hypothetical protein AB1483_09010 [Candidatus Zixiibacteriota bacterium]